MKGDVSSWDVVRKAAIDYLAVTGLSVVFPLFIVLIWVLPLPPDLHIKMIITCLGLSSLVFMWGLVFVLTAEEVREKGGKRP